MTDTPTTIERDSFLTNPSLNNAGMYSCQGCGETDLHFYSERTWVKCNPAVTAGFLELDAIECDLCGELHLIGPDTDYSEVSDAGTVTGTR